MRIALDLLLWSVYRVTADSHPTTLRWDAQDYRDAADLAFPHDPKMQADLRACANNMEAAAWLLEIESGDGKAYSAHVETHTTDGANTPGVGPAAALTSAAPAGAPSTWTGKGKPVGVPDHTTNAAGPGRPAAS